MKTQDGDMDTLIAALQSDLPGAEIDARMRARLAAAGACVGASVIGASAMHAASVAGVVGGAAKGASAIAGVKSGGLLSTVIGALPLTGGAGVKALVVAGAVVAGAGYPIIAPRVAAVFHPVNETAHEIGTTDLGSQLGRENTTPGNIIESHTLSSDHDRVNPAPINPAQINPAHLNKSEQTSVVQAEVVVSPPAAQQMLRSRARSQAERQAAAKNGAPIMAQATAETPVEQSEQSEVAAEQGVITASPNSGALAEEALLIERALRALRAGDRASAKGLLNVHQERFPTGKLTIERNRMWAELRD
jgi:hypothetical protein